MIRFGKFLLIVLCLGTCLQAANLLADSNSVYVPITRKKVITTAEAYLKHRWKPTVKNVFHGLDPEGIWVDTPDQTFSNPNYPPGWWIPNQTNIGIPYMWGGFCSLEEFDQGIKTGKYAGDIFTQTKRKHLGRACSQYAVGIDCSGLVSQCWQLPSHHSTRRLASVAVLLSDPAELKMGDILNKYNVHVLIFKAFSKHDKTKATFIHATAHKVKQEELQINDFLTRGFKPYRYKHILDQETVVVP